jgi:hypothetical protein
MRIEGGIDCSLKTTPGNWLANRGPEPAATLAPTTGVSKLTVVVETQGVAVAARPTVCQPRTCSRWSIDNCDGRAAPPSTMSLLAGPSRHTREAEIRRRSRSCFETSRGDEPTAGSPDAERTSSRSDRLALRRCCASGPSLSRQRATGATRLHADSGSVRWSLLVRSPWGSESQRLPVSRQLSAPLPARVAVVSSPDGRSGRCSRWGSARGSPGARALPPRTVRRAPPR